MGKEKDLYKGLEPFLNCKDHTVSLETYEIMINEKYDLLVTSPVPVDLSEYYKSESYISHTDSKKSLFDKIYQTVKAYTLKQKVALLNSFQTSHKTVLDVGAGTGDFLKKCKENHWKVFGVEPNKDARDLAEKKEIFLKTSLEDFSNQKFDVITLWHVLEHVENLKEYIVTLEKLLKEKGTLVIAVPNFKSYDAQFYKEYWAAFDVPRHLWHFSQTAIQKLFAEVGLTLVKTLPMKFDSFYVSLLSEKYKKGYTNIFNAFWVGLRSNLKAKRSSEYSSLIYVLKKK